MRFTKQRQTTNSFRKGKKKTLSKGKTAFRQMPERSPNKKRPSVNRRFFPSLEENGIPLLGAVPRVCGSFHTDVFLFSVPSVGGNFPETAST